MFAFVLNRARLTHAERKKASMVCRPIFTFNIPIQPLQTVLSWFSIHITREKENISVQSEHITQRTGLGLISGLHEGRSAHQPRRLPDRVFPIPQSWLESAAYLLHRHNIIHPAQHLPCTGVPKSSGARKAALALAGERSRAVPLLNPPEA